MLFRMKASRSSTMLDHEDSALKSLLDSFGSSCSLEDIASTFYKAKRDVKLAGELLSNKMTHSYSYNNEFSISSCTNGNVDLKVLNTKRNHVSSIGTVSNIIEENYVWRVKGNTIPNGTKPVTVDTNKFLGSKFSPEDPFSGKEVDAGLNMELENFLFEMLGQRFELERNAIHEVLGHCGYDMKSLETLLDLTAASWNQPFNLHEGSNLSSNSEILSFQNQLQSQKLSESGRRNMRANNLLSRKPNEIFEQQKEVLTSLFHVAGRPDLCAPAPVQKPVRSGLFGKVVTQPLEDIDEDHKTKISSHHLCNMKDEAEDDDYQMLRKAVREYRATMKEYYKSAAEAFASDDRARASKLIEKGQFFYKKAREADEESARKIFETSEDGELHDEIWLDLQHHDAKGAIRLLRSHIHSLCGISSIKNLKVIVGNDEKEVKKCRRLIIKLLEKENIKWIKDETSGEIVIRLDEIDPNASKFGRK